MKDTDSGHDYEAYQIFSGTLSKTTYTDTSKEDTYALSNIQWGDGVDQNAEYDINGDGEKENLVSALRTITGIENIDSADDVANVLKKDTNKDNATAVAFARVISHYLSSTKTQISSGNGKYEGTVSKPGYYLIVDETKTQTLTDDSNSRLILEVVKDIEVNPKKNSPKVEKKVQENTTVPNWQDTADYQIGDSVPYKLTGTLPSNLDYYSTYTTYTFTDTLTKGLVISLDEGKKPEDVTVTYYPTANDAASGTSGVDVTALFDASYAAYTTADSSDPYKDGHILTVRLKKSTDNGTTADIDLCKEYIVEKGAASTNVQTNPNGEKVAFASAGRFVVTYNATLTADAKVGTAEGNPNKVKLTYSNNPNGTGEGSTTEDKAIVFTYELDSYKGNNSNKALKDAEFVLLNSDGSKYAIIDGNHRIAGWVTQTIAEADKYKKSTYTTPSFYTNSETAILTSGECGLFSVIGLDAETYTLREVTPPTGYNQITSDIKITIVRTLTGTWDGVDNNKSGLVTSLTLTSTTSDSTIKVNEKLGTATAGDASTGIVTDTIINTPGASLPTTGGSGTRLFYIIGSLVVAATAVLLITRRKKYKAQ